MRYKNTLKALNVAIFLLCGQLVMSQNTSLFAGKAKTSGATNNNTNTSSVRFNSPSGMALDGAGRLWIVNEGSHTVSMFNPTDLAGGKGTFYTRAGGANAPSYVDGNGIFARFNSPTAIAIGDKIYISDAGNDCIRQMDTLKNLGTAQAVSLLAGDRKSAGYKDGTGTAAKFDDPAGLAIDSKGNIYVADEGNHCIRMITPAGVVTTYAGKGQTAGNADGDKDSKARFRVPSGLYIDSDDNLYVTDRGNGSVRLINAKTGMVTTVATGFNDPTYIFVNELLSELYVSDGCRMAGYTASRKDTLFAGKHPQACGYKEDSDTNALFQKVKAMIPVSNTALVVADAGNHVLRKIEIDPCDRVKADISSSTGSFSICDGESITLSVEKGTGYSYLWSDGSTSNELKVSKAGDYKITVSTVLPKVCSSSSQVKVDVKSKPLATVSVSKNKFCPGEEADLVSDEPGASYKWNDAGNATSRTLKVTAAGDYQVTITNGSGCKAVSALVKIEENVVVAPTISAQASTTLCEGEMVELQANSGYSNYKWSSGESGQNLETGKAGKYTVSADDANGCNATSNEIEVIVNPLPSKPLISESSGVLSSTLASTYQWLKEDVEIDGATSQDYTPSSNGNYSVIVTDETGCSNTSETYNFVIVGGEESELADEGRLDVSELPGGGLEVGFDLESDSDYLIQIVGVDGKVIFTYRGKGKKGANSLRIPGLTEEQKVVIVILNKGIGRITKKVKKKPR